MRPGRLTPLTLRRRALGLLGLPPQPVSGKVQRPAWHPNQCLPWIKNCVIQPLGVSLWQGIAVIQWLLLQLRQRSPDWRKPIL